MNYLSGFGFHTITDLAYGFGSRALWTRGIIGTPMKVATQYAKEPMAEAMKALTASLPKKETQTESLNDALGNRVSDGTAVVPKSENQTTDDHEKTETEKDTEGQEGTTTPLLTKLSGGSDPAASIPEDLAWVAGATAVYGTAASILETGVEGAIANTVADPLTGNPLYTGVSKIYHEMPGLSLLNAVPSVLGVGVAGWGLAKVAQATVPAFGDYAVDSKTRARISEIVTRQETLLAPYSEAYQVLLNNMFTSWSEAIQKEELTSTDPKVIDALKTVGDNLPPQLVALLAEDPAKAIPSLDQILTQKGITDQETKLAVLQHLAKVQSNAKIHTPLVQVLRNHFGYIPADLLHRYITGEGDEEMREWLSARGVEEKEIQDRLLQILSHLREEKNLPLSQATLAIRRQWDGYNDRIKKLEEGLSDTSVLQQGASLGKATLSFGMAALTALGWGSRALGSEAYRIEGSPYTLPPLDDVTEVQREEMVRELNPLHIELNERTSNLNVTGMPETRTSNALHTTAEWTRWASDNFMNAVVAGGAAYKGWHLWSAGYALTQSMMTDDAAVQQELRQVSKDKWNAFTSNLHHWAATAAWWDAVPTSVTDGVGSVVEKGLNTSGLSTSYDTHTLGRMALATPAAAKTLYHSAMFGYYSAKQWWTGEQAETLEEEKGHHLKGVQSALVAGVLNLMAYSTQFQGQILADGLDFAGDISQYGLQNAVEAKGLNIADIKELPETKLRRNNAYRQAIGQTAITPREGRFPHDPEAIIQEIKTVGQCNLNERREAMIRNLPEIWENSEIKKGDFNQAVLMFHPDKKCLLEDSLYNDLFPQLETLEVTKAKSYTDPT